MTDSATRSPRGRSAVRTSQANVQALLKRVGLYQRLKASRLYDLYWRIADRRIIEDRQREVEFYRGLLQGLRDGDLVFDVGASEGYKTDIFLRLGARVVALEPDPTSRSILEQRFLRYRLTRRPVTIIGKAVSDGETVQTMWVDEPGSAKNSLSRKWVETLRADEKRFGHTLNFAWRQEIATTTLKQLFREHGSPVFVKIDVEGYEPNVLRGMPRAVPFVSFEVNLPEFRPEGLECVELLLRLGADGKFNYAIDCRHGLELRRWLGARDFSPVLEACTEQSIEVFWKASKAGVREG